MIGAHAEGFNTGSVGVAVIGNYYDRRRHRRRRGRRSSSLLAWRLDVAHVDPLGTRRLDRPAATRSTGAGTPVELRAISGHRDTGFT